MTAVSFVDFQLADVAIAAAAVVLGIAVVADMFAVHVVVVLNRQSFEARALMDKWIVLSAPMVLSGSECVALQMDYKQAVRLVTIGLPRHQFLVPYSYR